MGDVQYVRTICRHYKRKDEVVADIVSLCERQPGLFPEQQAYTYDDGRVELLVRVYGIIPISLRGVSYNCPIAIWLPLDYPTKAPFVYVTPVPGMIVRTGRHVDPNGLVSISYLSDWQRKNGEGFSLLPLVDNLEYAFSKEYPLVSVAASQQQRQQPVASTRSRPPRQAPTPPMPPPGRPGSGPPRPPMPPVLPVTSSPSPPVPPYRPSPTPPVSQPSPALGPPRPPQMHMPQPPPFPSHHPPAPAYPAGPSTSVPSPQPPMPPTFTPPQPPQWHQQQASASAAPAGYHQHQMSVPAVPAPQLATTNGPSARPAVQTDDESVRPRRQSQGFTQKRERRRSVTFAEQPVEFSPVSPDHQYVDSPVAIQQQHEPSRRSAPGPMPPINHARRPSGPSHDALQPVTSRQEVHRAQPDPTRDAPPSSSRDQVQAYRPVSHAKARASRSSRSSRSAKPAVNILDSPDDTTSASTDTRAAAPPIPVNPAVLAARARLHTKLSQSLASLRQYTEHEVSQLSLLESDLSKGVPAIEDEMSRLRAVKAVCETVRDRYASVVREGESRLREYELKGDGPEVDEIVCSSTIVYNQLLELVAEDAALEDTIYHLGRSINSDAAAAHHGGAAADFDLDRFLKRVRTLAREQFLKRALINKIVFALEARRNKTPGALSNTNGTSTPIN